MSEETHERDPNTGSEPNVGVIRAYYKAVARGDLPTVLDLLHPQVEWRAPQSLPWGGTYHWTVRHGKIVSLEEYFDTAIVLRALQLQPAA